MSHKDRLKQITKTLLHAKEKGILLQDAEDDFLFGRTIRLRGNDVLNFGSCSYLGLEIDERLKNAAKDAIDHFGVHFSSSRAYMSMPLYHELESLLSEIAGSFPVVIGPTTTLSHLSAIPVLVSENDVVLYDVQVHASVQTSLFEVRTRKIPCESLKHNNMELLDARVTELSKNNEKVFYFCDGVYSMYGDLMPVDKIYDLLDKHPKLHVYVDDAHGVSWSGSRGAGTILGRKNLHERMTVVLGLAKGFATGGAAIVVPTQEIADTIRTCGRTMIFSGPLEPSQLGSAIASAKIHLSNEIETLQKNLQERMKNFDELVLDAKLNLVQAGTSPIKFIEIGDEFKTIDVIEKLTNLGFFTNLSCFPAVPYKKAGVRIVLNLNQHIDDIKNLVIALKTCVG